MIGNKKKSGLTTKIKDRVYYLKQNRSSLSYSMKSSGIYYFDEEENEIIFINIYEMSPCTECVKIFFCACVTNI